MRMRAQFGQGATGEGADEFFKASRYGDARRLTKILDKNPEFNVNSRDTMGQSPLRLAVKNNHMEVGTARQ